MACLGSSLGIREHGASHSVLGSEGVLPARWWVRRRDLPGIALELHVGEHVEHLQQGRYS
jgi:hypothetical protein